MIAFFSIGFSAADPAVRNVGWDLPRIGWQKFADQQVGVLTRWGVRRVQLHNPFGALGGEAMQFSQWVQAKRLGIRGVTDRDAFVKAWKPITAAGVEVIAYVGSPTSEDREFRALLESRADEAAITRFEDECLEPFIASGMSIALDAASGQDQASATFKLAERLRASGTHVFIEALPLKTAKHWDTYPAMCTMWFWNNPDRPNWGVTETSAGTVLLADGGNPVSWADWDREVAAYGQLMSGGRTVAIGAWGLLKLARSHYPIDRLAPATQPIK